ncbi:enoyl-CoA hydratase-related protein [Nonomuraea sp. NPDC048916]|uniref:enoyl-CoA hydratase-related protein n=1 Tax=Nonomuraea sp. NPDC048916 TaxID=3154232 RepID=UPI0034098C7C
MAGGMRVRREGALIRATLDRPPVNALDCATYRRLGEICAAARPEECLLVDAAGRAFCAGQDLDEHERATAAGRLGESLTEGAGALAAVLRCPAPVVVAVQGPAIGAGALLAAAADIAVFAEDAWLRVPELDVGVTVGYAVLSRLLPPPLARRALLTSERVAAPVLDRLGAAVVVPPADLAEVSTRLATGLLGKPSGMVALARRSWGGGERELAARAYEAEVRDFLTR